MEDVSFHWIGNTCRGEAIISDPWACWDMTFSIHIGANAPTDPPVLKVGAGCQPGAKCTLCGCCGRRREAYLEVNDPKSDNKTVALSDL